MRTKTGPQDQVAKILFGRLRGQVLGLLLADPNRRFYLREMVRMTGSSPGTLQREMGILAKAGLVLRERRGRQVYYQANASAPVFPELRGLVRKTMSVFDVIRNALAPLADRIRAAVVFGSAVRGTLTATSDIDIAVVGDLELSEVLEAIKPAELELGREINPVVYLPREFRQRLKDKRHFVRVIAGGPRVSIMGNLDVA